MDLANATVIVTGAGTGVGRALALEFARHGAHVVCVGRRREKLGETASLIEADGGVAMAVSADVTDIAQVDAIVAQTVERFGGLDVLFNSAGSFAALGPIWEVDPDTWWRDVTVNLRGTMLCCRAVIPHMNRAGRGIILNMLGGDRIPGGTGYSCSKVAIPRFTELLARELEREGSPVLVFGMGPGFVRTEMTELQIDTPEGRYWLPSSKEAIDAGKDRPPEDCARKTIELIRIANPKLNGQSFGVGTDFTKV